MLCSDCYGIVGELVNFMENVNKVQPIFELLRHTEPNEQLDVFALRQQYGLQDRGSEGAYKTEPADAESSRENSLERERHIYFQEVDNNNQLDLTLSPTPIPVKRKRGRPKGSKKILPIESCEQPQVEMASLKLEASIDLDEDLSSTYESVDQALMPNHIWLEDCHLEEKSKTLNGAVKRKRGRPKLSVKMELLEEWKESGDHNPPSPNSIAEPQKKDELFTSDQSTIKRKRGRPRKQNQVNGMIDVHDESLSKCKNVALARLLFASPGPEAEGDTSVKFNPNVNQFKKYAVTCNMCHKELSSEIGLKYHIERVHMKKKPFVCDVCGKRVRTVSELKEHMLVHTDDRPFVCPICNAAFKNRKRLNVNRRFVIIFIHIFIYTFLITRSIIKHTAIPAMSVKSVARNYKRVPFGISIKMFTRTNDDLNAVFVALRLRIQRP